MVGLSGYRGLVGLLRQQGRPRRLHPVAGARARARAGITVNSVAPGYLRTEMSHGLDESQLEQIARRTPAGRLGEPEDIGSVLRLPGLARRRLRHRADAGGRRRPDGVSGREWPDLWWSDYVASRERRKRPRSEDSCARLALPCLLVNPRSALMRRARGQPQPAVHVAAVAQLLRAPVRDGLERAARDRSPPRLPHPVGMMLVDGSTIGERCGDRAERDAGGDATGGAARDRGSGHDLLERGPDGRRHDRRGLDRRAPTSVVTRDVPPGSSSPRVASPARIAQDPQSRA